MFGIGEQQFLESRPIYLCYVIKEEKKKMNEEAQRRKFNAADHTHD